MSGKRKRIKIERGEYERLLDAAGRLQDVRRDLPRLLEEVRRQSQADAERSRAEVEARQRSLQRALSALGDQAAEFERLTAQRIAQHERALRENRAHMDSALAEERQLRERQVRELSKGLDTLLQDQARAVAAAQRWVADARIMLSQADELPHERFAPGRLARLRDRLALAEANLDGKLFGPAITTAQDAYYEVSELRAEVELLDLSWRRAQQDAREKLLLVRALIKNNEHPPAVDEAGQEIPGTTISVDWWANGHLEALNADVDRLLARIGSGDPGLTEQELHRIADAESAQLEERLAAAVREARVLALASEARHELAKQVVKSLRLNGYLRIDDSAYADGDQRNAFFAKVTHVDGSQIVVEVAHTGEPPHPEVFYNYVDKTVHSQEVHAQVIEALREQLKAQGIKAEAPVRVGESTDRALIEFTRRQPARGQ